jgi:hypothetical protein
MIVVSIIAAHFFKIRLIARHCRPSAGSRAIRRGRQGDKTYVPFKYTPSKIYILFTPLFPI